MAEQERKTEPMAPLSQVRRAQMLALASLCLAACNALGLAGARRSEAKGPGKTVRAPFTVVNEDGRPIFKVGATDEGGRMWVYRKAGGTAIVLGPVSDGSQLTLANKAGTSTTVLLASPSGGRVLLTNPTGFGAVFLGADKNGEGVLRLFDLHPRISFSAP